jgi:hypothetical protein
MRLSWRRSSRAEDRFESWITQQHQRRVLAGETTPSGPCPDEGFLRDLARKSKSIALSDPRIDHTANCRKCMSRLLELRGESRSHRQRIAFTTAITACALIAVSVVVTWYVMQRKAQPANNAAVVQTVNLWDSGTVRGEQPGQLESVSLPAALVKVTIILPRHSAPGLYLVAITRDQNGNGVVAEGTSTTVANGEQQEITAGLDLRKAAAGPYFLSTTHEQDQAAYYYPLQIR